MLIYESFKNMNLEPNVIMEVDSIEANKQMVKKEIGIAILSKFTIEEELKSEQLYMIKVVDMPKINRNFDLISCRSF